MEQINVDVNNGNMSRVDTGSSYYIIDIRMNRIKRVIEGIVAFDPVVCASYPNLTLESFDFNTAYYSDKGVYRFTAQVIDPMTNEYLQDLLGIIAREFRSYGISDKVLAEPIKTPVPKVYDSLRRHPSIHHFEIFTEVFDKEDD